MADDVAVLKELYLRHISPVSPLHLPNQVNREVEIPGYNEGLFAMLRDRSTRAGPIPPLHLASISRSSPLYLPFISPSSRLYLAYVPPASPVYLPTPLRDAGRPLHPRGYFS